MSTLKKNLAGTTAVLLLLGSKLKWLLVLLKFTKLSTLISMFISFGVYAAFYGWKFGAALIYLLFVHEAGHLLAAKRKGLPVSPAIFIPFMGAAIGLKEKPKNAKDEAYIAYGGPLFGLLSFLPAVPLYVFTENPFWGMVIGLGALLNLFNLLPVSPLDGGRIVTVLSTKIWFIGLLLLIPLIVVDQSAIAILIFIIGFITWWQRMRENYQIKVLTGEIAVLEEVKSVYERLQTNASSRMLVYEPARSMEENIQLRYMKEQYEQKEQHCRQQLQSMKTKSVYLPFIHDEKKRKKELVKFRCMEYKKAAAALQTSRSLLESEESIRTEIKARKAKVQSLKTYYLTTKKEKWLWLLAYLLLIIVLGGFYIFGSGLMTQLTPFAA